MDRNLSNDIRRLINLAGGRNYFSKGFTKHPETLRYSLPYSEINEITDLLYKDLVTYYLVNEEQ